MTADPFQSLGQSFFSAFTNEMNKSASARPAPKSNRKPKAARRQTVTPDHALPRAASQGPPVPTVPTPELVLLEGMFDGKYLGHYSLSYAMGQLMVDVYQASPAIGGMYAVDGLPIGEWFVLADKRGFLLPVAVQRVRIDAYHVRVDPAPLQGLRALPAAYGAAPPPVAAQPGRQVPPARWAAQPQPTSQQARQNDQAAIRALQTGSQASYNAMMNTARHVHS
jgi:hypothetical protein